MSRYRLTLEINDASDYGEEIIDEFLRSALEENGIGLLKISDYEQIEEDEEELLRQMQEFANNYEDEDIEVTYDNGTYYVLHICQNNTPVPLFFSEVIDDIKDYMESEYDMTLD